MNKFQKVAVQMTKDDIKKGSVKLHKFRECRNAYMVVFRTHMTHGDIRDALGFKNFNKCLSI